MTQQNITIMFIIFFTLKFIITIYLDLKNKKHIKKNRANVPDNFKEQVTLQDHQKAADYSDAKIKFGLFSFFKNSLILLGWTLGGGLQVLDNVVKSFSLGNISSGIIFFLLFSLISLLLGMPESIYSTFILEERFGFNKTTPKTFITDLIKGLALGIVLGLPLLALILWFMEKTGDGWWIYAATSLISFQLLITWLYPTLIAPIFNKFEPLSDGDVKESINELATKSDFPNGGIFVMDGSKRSGHGNAYFTGFGKNKRIVFFDTLIEKITTNEVVAILAHEIGHYKKKHILKHILTSTVMTIISFYILGLLYKTTEFYLGHGVSSTSSYMALALFSMVSGVYTYLFTPLFQITSRKHEFEADRFAAKYSKAEDLISGLVKLYVDNASSLTPDPTYSKFYHSHPPASIRIAALNSLKEDK